MKELWVIRNDTGEFWSNTLGWTKYRDLAAEFDAAEMNRYLLPVGGQWYQPAETTDADDERALFFIRKARTWTEKAIRQIEPGETEPPSKEEIEEAIYCMTEALVTLRCGRVYAKSMYPVEKPHAFTPYPEKQQVCSVCNEHLVEHDEGQVDKR